jgi:hypothetical protein
VGNEISRLLQSCPWNPRKQWHLPSTQSPLKLHELGHWPDTDTGSELQSSECEGQINSPIKDKRVNCLHQIIENLTSTYKQLKINKIAVLLTIKSREQNGSTSTRTHFPYTIHSNLQWKYEASLIFVIKENELKV